MHLVYRVVHRLNKILNVAPVERGNERATNLLHDLPRDLVGLVLLIDDYTTISGNFLSTLEQLLECIGAVHQCLRVSFEKIEEFFLAGEKLLVPPHRH